MRDTNNVSHDEPPPESMFQLRAAMNPLRRPESCEVKEIKPGNRVLFVCFCENQSPLPSIEACGALRTFILYSNAPLAFKFKTLFQKMFYDGKIHIISIYYFNHFKVQFSSIKYIHIAVQPSLYFVLSSHHQCTSVLTCLQYHQHL